MSNTDDVRRIVVVGQNRSRLSKIMKMVEEEQAQSIESKFDLRTQFSPCLAAMDAYEDDQGNLIRYMKNIVCHDGSPMTKLLDDDEFRQSLKCVLMVGYDWKDGDDEQLSKYFETSNLPVPVECVQPNSGIDTLREEMDIFKNLDEADKRQHVEANSMGPGKMALFIIKIIQGLTTIKILDERSEEVSNERADASTEGSSQEVQGKKQLIIEPGLPSFACRICRTLLFGHDHLAREHVQNLHSFKKANFNARRPTVACQSIFCNEEVLPWLSEYGQDVEGKLACPKCEYKLGHWRWSGAQVGHVVGA